MRSVTIEVWSTEEAAKKAGCTFRQLDYWARCGFVRPLVAARGSGSARKFDAAGVQAAFDLARLARLTNAGRNSGGLFYAVKGAKDLTALADAVELAFREYGP